MCMGKKGEWAKMDDVKETAERKWDKGRLNNTVVQGGNTECQCVFAHSLKKGINRLPENMGVSQCRCSKAVYYMCTVYK